MTTAIKKCRVCGKPYEACRSARNVAGVFRWQEVACSRECGLIYLAKIEESRKIKPLKVKDEIQTEDLEAVDLIDDEDEYEFDDNELDEYFDDAK